MARSIFRRLVVITSCILILISVVLLAVAMATSDERNEIKVDLKDGVTESVEFEGIALVPGESCEYVIKFKGDSFFKYDTHLDFVEKEEKTLKNFAYVRVMSGDEVVYDELLATAFESDGIDLSVDFFRRKNTELKIVYYMPLDVGNEAKNAEAIFELQITAYNE